MTLRLSPERQPLEGACTVEVSLNAKHDLWFIEYETVQYSFYGTLFILQRYRKATKNQLIPTTKADEHLH